MGRGQSLPSGGLRAANPGEGFLVKWWSEVLSPGVSLQGCGPPVNKIGTPIPGEWSLDS